MKTVVAMILGVLWTMGVQTMGVRSQQAVAGDKVQTVSKDGLKIEGKLQATDPKVKVQIGPFVTIDVPAKSFLVKMSAAKQYRLVLEGAQIESVLTVHDKTGKQLAFDDGAGGTRRESKVVLLPPNDDTYKVYAGAESGEGAFALLITEETKALAGKEVFRVEGEIRQGEPKVRVTFSELLSQDLPAKSYQVKLLAGKRYRFSMNSVPIDSVVAVHDKTGKQLAFDDDGGGFPNALLLFTPSNDDIYKVYTASLQGNGKFTLVITEDAMAQITAIPFRKEDRLDQFAKTRMYPVRLEQGKTYIIEMLSPLSQALEPYVLLKESGQIVAQHDSVGQLMARITVDIKATKTYEVEATSYWNKPGADPKSQAKGLGTFTLTIREKRPALAAELRAGVFKTQGTLLDSDPKDELLTKSPSQVYGIQLARGKYAIELESANFDCFLRIEDSHGNQLAFDDDGGAGSNARIAFDAARNDNYRIFVTSLDRRVGNYSLVIRQQ